MEFISQTAEQVLKLVNQTQKTIFLTGKAGTGKTTLLKKIIETTHKNAVVVAPTGIAAVNISSFCARAETLHSFFGLPIHETEISDSTLLNIKKYKKWISLN